MIYFIQQGESGEVKIGYSTNVQERLRGLQTGHATELRLLGTMPGDRRDERRLHHLFADYRVRGEWFRPRYRLLKFVRDNCPDHLELVGPPTKCEMSWEQTNRRWWKMRDGRRYVVSCRQLSQWSGERIPETKEQSWLVANAWWAAKLDEIYQEGESHASRV